MTSDTFTYASDATVRMRHTSRGDLQILSLDGKIILDEIPRASLEAAAKRAETTMDEPTAECRGFMIGMLCGSVIWVSFFYICKWVAGA